MTDDHARALADVAVVGLGAVAAYYVVRTPPLRRAAWRLLKYGVLTAAPGYVWREITHAWAESAPRAAGARTQNVQPGTEPGTGNLEAGTAIIVA